MRDHRAAKLGVLVVVAATAVGLLVGRHAPTPPPSAAISSPGTGPTGGPVADPVPACSATAPCPTTRAAAQSRPPRLGEAPQAGDRTPRFSSTTVLLGVRPGTPRREQRRIEAVAGAHETRTIGGTVHVLKVSRGAVRVAVRILRRQPAVRYAEPDYTMHESATPDDPSFGAQWGMQNTGQGVPYQDASEGPPGTSWAGTAGADVGAPAAWNATTGSRSIVIGETDTGVDYHHPDLAANIWSNDGTVNGCATGTHGYNEIAQTCDPMDDDAYYGGHGTHVAGILGAVGNNGTGVSGINWSTRILPVKWLDSSGNGTTSNLVAALDWLLKARQAGVNVRVVNDSATFYGTASSQALSDEIDLLGQSGILFVTAAGNTGNDMDDPAHPEYLRYPCGYNRPSEICVTATDHDDRLPGWANYGTSHVDLAAPGTSVSSTLRNGTYGYLSGGSMASPMVAGAAALILSAKDLSVTALKADILDNVDVLPSLSGKVRTGGRLDLCKALPTCGPLAQTGPATSIGRTSATVSGTVNPEARATSYRFDYGTTSAYGSRTPTTADAPVGSDRTDHSGSQSLSGLAPSTTYHFRIVATNAAGTTFGGDQTFTTQRPPLVSLTGPSSGSVTNDPQPTFSGSAGTASGDSSTVTVSLYRGTGPSGTALQSLSTTVSSGGSWSVRPAGALNDGTYTAVARQADAAGTTGSSSPSTFTVDATPPTVALAAPTDGAHYAQGQALAASYSCGDGAGGSGATMCVGTVADGQPIDTRGSGQKSFTLTAWDKAGNLTTRTVHYTVDAPVLLSIRAGTVLASTRGRVQLSGAGASCAGAPCRVTVVATGTVGRPARGRRPRPLTLASARFTVASGRTVPVAFVLTPAARAALARAGSLKAVVTATETGAGARQTRTVKITIRAPRARTRGRHG